MAFDYERVLDVVRGPWSLRVVPLGIIWTIQLLIMSYIFPLSIAGFFGGLLFWSGLIDIVAAFYVMAISLFTLLATVFEAVLFYKRPDTIRGVEWSSGFYLGSALCKAIAWTLPCIGVLFGEVGNVKALFYALGCLLAFYLPLVYAWRVQRAESGGGGAGALYI